MDQLDNLTLGRGKLYFERFATGSRVPTGMERYLGGTSAVAVNQSATKLDHYSMEGGRKVKDRSVDLQNDQSGSFTTDNIDLDNVALWYLGERSTVTIASATGEESAFESVKLGTYLQLGVSDATPHGARNVTSVTAAITGGAAVNAAGNFEVDLALGRVYLLPDAADIDDADDLTFTFNISAGSEEMVIPDQAQIYGALRFIADNAEGDNQDHYWPYVQLTADGAHDLKGDDWQTMSFNFEVLKRDSTTPPVIISKRAAS